MPKTRIKKKTNTTGGFQDLGYTLTDDEITKISEIDNKINKVSSTDNAIARFDGTTGVIQNSKVTITDAGDIYSNGTKVVVESALNGLATETFVTEKIANLVDSAPEELNTLNELAAGITANKGVLETVTDAIGNKAPNNHASTATTYGVATTSKYGHVKISNGDVNTVTSSNGVAAGMDHSHSNYVQTGRAINGYTLTSDITLTASDVGAEPAFTKNTAFNKNFGTISGTVCQGNDSRLSDARTPKTHTHVKADITDFPTIPTVNNGTLTIQKNGTNVQTFTANQSTNVTANITVPTKTSDLTNDSGFITSADLPTGGGVTSVVGQTGAITADQIKSGMLNSYGGFAIGDGATATPGGAIGNGASATNGFAGGDRAVATTGGAVGLGASTSSGFAGGQGAVASWGGVAIGYAAQATITEGSSGYSSVAIGNSAQATKKNAIQLGYGTNSTADTLQFMSYQLLDANGKIPYQRFSQNFVRLGMKNGKGTFALSESLENFSFILLISINAAKDLYRGPTVIPVSWIKGVDDGTSNYGKVFGIESWDGGRYRIRFNNATQGELTAEWYATDVTVYGIR